MEVFHREGTRKTPDISFDPGTGVFEITGRSYDENIFEFYDDLFLWIDQYLKVPLSITNLIIGIDYFDTASYKCIVQILQKLETIQDKNHQIKITWLYEKDDEEIREAGEDLKEITSLAIELKKIKSSNERSQVKKQKGA